MSQSDRRHHRSKPRKSLKALLFGLSCIALVSGSASAAVITTQMLADVTKGPVSIGINKSGDFTFSDVLATADPSLLAGVGVATSAGGSVASLFSMPASYSYPARNFQVFGPGTPFESYSAPAAIPYSLGSFAIGLTETVLDQTYYGFAVFQGTTLTSYTFETTPGVALVLPVPLPSSAPLLGAAIVTFGVAGYGVRRAKGAEA